MLLDKEIKIKWANPSKRYYEALGYKFTKQGNEFIILTEQLHDGSNMQVRVQCDYCGVEFSKRYYALINGRISGKDCCRKCSGKKNSNAISKGRINENNCFAEKFPDLIKEWHPTKNGNKTPFDYSYGSSLKVWWICHKGHEYKMTPHGRTNQKSNCPQCNLSKGELRIAKSLNKLDIYYLREYTFDNLLSENGNCLRFDFALFKKDKLSCLIEYDGEQHYNPIYGEEKLELVNYRDNLKNKYCEENNIKLIRIPYWEFDNIEEIIKREA